MNANPTPPNSEGSGYASTSPDTKIKIWLVAIVSVGWVAVVIVPPYVGLDIDAHTIVGVQGLMVGIVGAYFGISFFKKKNGNGGSE